MEFCAAEFSSGPVASSGVAEETAEFSSGPVASSGVAEGTAGEAFSVALSAGEGHVVARLSAWSELSFCARPFLLSVPAAASPRFSSQRDRESSLPVSCFQVDLKCLRRLLPRC